MNICVLHFVKTFLLPVFLNTFKNHGAIVISVTSSCSHFLPCLISFSHRFDQQTTASKNNKEVVMPTSFIPRVDAGDYHYYYCFSFLYINHFYLYIFFHL